MDKLKKHILFILLISILLCSVQAIAAADVSDADGNDIFDLSNDIETVQADSNDEVLDAPSSGEVLTADAGNFTELESKINGASGYLLLDKDYTKKSGEQSITISKNSNFVLDGGNHTISADFINGIFTYNPNFIHRKVVITLQNIKFVNTKASALTLTDYAKVKIINCTFTDCTARNGGAISYDGSSCAIDGCTFTNCNASGSGGAIYVQYTGVTINNSQFTGNKAGTGSAIYANSQFTISNTKLLENKANARSISLEEVNPVHHSTYTEFDGFYITFDGNDNLFNAIYAGDTVRATNVTYYNGTEAKTPATSTNYRGNNYHEAGMTINLIIYDSETGDMVRNITCPVLTNGSGRTVTLEDEWRLEPGYYKATAVHYEDAYYTEISKKWTGQVSDVFHVTREKWLTNITNATVEGYAGDSADVEFDITRLTGSHEAVKNGTVTVTIGETNYTGTVSNGKATVTITALPDASGEFNVTYNDPTGKYYWSSNSTLKVTILEPVDTTITVSPQNITVGSDETVSFSIDPTAVTGNVSVVIKDDNGNTVYTNNSVAIADGQFTVPANLLPAGTYNVTVSFAGNKYYNPSNGSEIFTVSKLASVVEVTPQNITVDDDEIIKFTVTGDGSVAPSGNVTITITGNDIEYSKVIENTPISSGEAGVKVSGLPAGTYTVKVEYGGDGNYNASSDTKTFTVSKLASVVEVTPQNIKVGDNETISFTVTGDGSVAPSGNVTITVTGPDTDETYQGVDIATGSIKLTGLPAGTYTVKVEYGGDGNYNASSDTKTFKVDKRDVKVEVLTDVIGYDGDEITVIIKVTDSETGKAVTGGTVEYTIDYTTKLGSTASITLGADVTDGTAEQKVKLSGKPGTYAAMATYSGNGMYNDGLTDDKATILEQSADDNSTDENSTDDTPADDNSTDGGDAQADSQPVASKSVETLATGNPIAMLVLVLLTLVSTISIRRQK